MNLSEQLQTHSGGLIRLKSQLFWYGPCGWDKTHERICLLLGAAVSRKHYVTTSAFTFAAARGAKVAAHLLIDGQPHWVWVTEKDVELIDEAR